MLTLGRYGFYYFEFFLYLLASLLLDMPLDNDTDCMYSIVVANENLLLEFLPK